MSNDSRAQVLQAINIVELISQTVALKRRGRSFVGLCPFHQEKTPSFHVNPERQSFYCFGCKSGGTAFDFVMKRDRVEFREALEILARQASIDLPQFGGAKQNKGERAALLDANSAACRFFENLLHHPEIGAPARQYLAGRGFTDESIKQFQVGLAPDGWDGLLKSPVARKLTPQILVQAGLIKSRERDEGFYDTFRNRIMFPIRSEAGQIIAFGGRVMPGSTDPAKYLNSPETPLFSKSRCIFGLDLARQRIVETRTVAVVEGYTDVVMAHQFGASNVVSVLGTAMTEQHVAILRRFADRIVLLFDADTAGDAAVDRVVQLFLTQPVDIAVASMPDGLDPDEYLLKFGLETFDKLLKGATGALDYAWKQLSSKFNSEDFTDQQKLVQQYLDLMASARGSGPVDSIRWGMALAQVSKLSNIPVEQLHRRFKSKPRQARNLREEPSPAATPAGDAPHAPPRALTAQDRAERWILGALLLDSSRWTGVQFRLDPAEFAEELRRHLAERIWEYQREEGQLVFSTFLSELPQDALRLLAIELADEVEQLPDVNAALDGALEHLSELRRNRQDQKDLAQARQSKEAHLAEADEVELLKRLQETARKPDLRRVGS